MKSRYDLTKSPFDVSFKLLVADLEDLISYVAPTDRNEGTFSHRLYALQLRCCTEFESISKSVLGITRGTIGKYSELEEKFDLARFQVGYHHWLPTPRYSKPFGSWGTQPRTTPPWYKAYTDVKHNRHEMFEQANLANTLDALCACFLLLNQADLNPYVEAHSLISVPPGRTEITFSDCPFTVRQEHV